MQIVCAQDTLLEMNEANLTAEEQLKEMINFVQQMTYDFEVSNHACIDGDAITPIHSIVINLKVCPFKEKQNQARTQRNVTQHHKYHGDICNITVQLQKFQSWETNSSTKNEYIHN